MRLRGTRASSGHYVGTLYNFGLGDYREVYAGLAAALEDQHRSSERDERGKLGTNASDWLLVGSSAVGATGLATEATLNELTNGGSRIFLGNKAKYLAAKSASLKLGMVGVALSTYDIYDQGLNTGRGLDLVMAGVAFVPVVGWIASGTYFAANLVTLGATGQSIGDHIQGGTASWKPWK